MMTGCHRCLRQVEGMTVSRVRNGLQAFGDIRNSGGQYAYFPKRPLPIGSYKQLSILSPEFTQKLLTLMNPRS